MRGGGIAARAGVLVVVAGLLAGCGLSADSSPHDISSDQRRPLVEQASSGIPRPGTSARIYFLASAEQGRSTRLQAVGRDVAPVAPAQVLTALFEGLTTQERDARLRTAIPAGTKLLSTQLINETTLAVDVSPELYGASGEVLTDAVAQIVFTAHRVNNAFTVQLSVDGVEQEWPIGDGSLVSRPLSVFDYPNRSVSSQPDYPSLPSPDAQTLGTTPTTTTVAAAAR